MTFDPRSHHALAHEAMRVLVQDGLSSGLDWADILAATGLTVATVVATAAEAHPGASAPKLLDTMTAQVRSYLANIIGAKRG